jgi:MFS superfamily sulfate permease-like transporter
VTDLDEGPASWITGRSKPPTWFRLIGCLALIAVAAGLVAKRGVVVGVVAAVVYGLIGLSQLLAWERMTDWSKRHPLLDSLIIVPLLFLAVAYFTKLSVAICVLIALLAGLLLVALGLVRRRARQRNAL